MRRKTKKKKKNERRRKNTRKRKRMETKGKRGGAHSLSVRPSKAQTKLSPTGLGPDRLEPDRLGPVDLARNSILTFPSVQTFNSQCMFLFSLLFSFCFCLFLFCTFFLFSALVLFFFGLHRDLPTHATPLLRNPPLPGPPKISLCFFPSPAPCSLFFSLSRGVFSWYCGRGSRSWTTQIVRLGFSAVILCEPRRPTTDHKPGATTAVKRRSGEWVAGVRIEFRIVSVTNGSLSP